MKLSGVSVEAGAHNRTECPLEFTVGDGATAGVWRLIDGAGEATLLEVDEAGYARCIVSGLEAGATRKYTLEKAPPRDRAVCVTETGGSIALAVRGERVTNYLFGNVAARPCFFPVFAPGEVPLTRNYPMVPDAPGETRDHPHHRSMWIAFGDVNGADNWSEERGHAATVHLRTVSAGGGRVSGHFTTVSEWRRTSGSPLLNQRLTVRAWSVGPSAHLLDFEIKLHAAHGPVEFGDTKEGGMLSVRVASELDVPRTGRISNVFGGVNESECWGMASHWCDYSGTVGGTAAGLAILDHPYSFRHPTHWHVRNYGLMTANPFGYAAYTGGIKSGSHTLLPDQELLFRYRVVLHRGSCSEARIAERYLDFATPPRVRLDHT